MFMYVFCVNLLFLETARLYIYSPLRIQEIGLGDGEVMEKLWSFLRHLILIARLLAIKMEMSRNHLKNCIREL